MINQVQNNGQISTLPYDTYPGQKVERSSDVPQPIVDRKQEVPSAREEIPREEVEKTTEKLNRLMGIIDKRLSFSVHEESHRVMVKVIDQVTGDVINEIPPKKILDLLSSFTKLAGLVLDKRV
jgi:flagellar protein FlaG